MAAHGSVEPGILLRHGHSVAGGFQAAAGVHNQRHLPIGKTCQKGFSVCIECPIIQVGMGVKKHGSASKIVEFVSIERYNKVQGTRYKVQDYGKGNISLLKRI